MNDTEREIATLKLKLAEAEGRLKNLTNIDSAETKAELKQFIEKASQNLKQYVDDNSVTIKEKLDKAQVSTKEAGKKAQEYAQENPWHIAALGVVTGLAISLIAGRRNKD